MKLDTNSYWLELHPLGLFHSYFCPVQTYLEVIYFRLSLGVFWSNLGKVTLLYDAIIVCSYLNMINAAIKLQIKGSVK